jgi:hypothetical protein
VVQHHVAEDEHAGFGGSVQDLPRTGGRKYFCAHVFIHELRILVVPFGIFSFSSIADGGEGRDEEALIFQI